MRAQLILIFSLCMIISCKKDVPQGIIPKAYFPAFAGSSWTYADDNGALITYSTGPEYVVDEFEHEGEHYIGKVPVYEGKYVWGYAFRGGNSTPVRFLDDKKPVGSILTQTFWQGSGTATRIIARDTSVNVAGVDHYPTIIVESGWSYPMQIPGTRKYYTKNIGLVKIEKFDRWGELASTLSLVSYFINR